MHFKDFEFDPNSLIGDDPMIAAGELILDDFDPYTNKRSSGVSKSVPTFVGTKRGQ